MDSVLVNPVARAGRQVMNGVRTGPSATVSVIIPALDEEHSLPSTLRALRQEQPREVIVVDGGSTDGTCAVARDSADVLLSGPRGRASQMNLGAAHAQGDVLLFLHADCTLASGALAEAERLVASRRYVAGCFRMCVGAPDLLYRSIDACATARVRLTGIVYGDQGLFLSKELFTRLGGFPSLPFMEDLFFSRTLRREGRIAVAAKRIFVSPRRWRRAGLVRQTLRNWALTALAVGGVHPEKLAAFYAKVR